MIPAPNPLAWDHNSNATVFYIPFLLMIGRIADMEIDGQEASKSKSGSGRIRKRARTRSRSKAVFAPHPSKLKQNTKKR